MSKITDMIASARKFFEGDFRAEPYMEVGRHVDIWGGTPSKPEGWEGHGWYCHLDGLNHADESWGYPEAEADARAHWTADHADVEWTVRITPRWDVDGPAPYEGTFGS